jgi:LysR family glycine cleavage system transcriptional activator
MSRRLPPLTALRAFEAAARHGSFARAADELAVTHAAVSRQVRELEAWLGVPLFARLHRGVRLSAAGERYLGSLTVAFDSMAEATAAVLGTGSAASLTVSLEPAFAVCWLVPRLAGFRARHPDVELVLDPSSELVDFRSEAVDLAIRYGDGDWPELEIRHLLDIVAFPVCSKAILRDGPALRSPVDLRGHVLLHDDDTEAWQEWLALAGAQDVDGSRGYRYGDSKLALDAAVAGQGVALGDNLLAAADLAAGRLVRPFAAPVSPCRAYYLVAPEAHRERPAVAAFWRWIEDEMALFAAAPQLAKRATRARRR